MLQRQYAGWLKLSVWIVELFVERLLSFVILQRRMEKRKSEIEKLNITVDLSIITTKLSSLRRKWFLSTVRSVLVREGQEDIVEEIDKMLKDLEERILTLKRE
ncbi:MAG: hypothetical protein KAV48_03835 [Methanomicrobia archaeon]|nr:hypothetical protein [Methanomicrobia archaeon]